MIRVSVDPFGLVPGEGLVMPERIVALSRVVPELATRRMNEIQAVTGSTRILALDEGGGSGRLCRPGRRYRRLRADAGIRDL